ncbi:MAG: DNRLRE domain-containing protein [Gammaproteobacteria bacterium]|nr:MAG: DNRLRE domain-containing protein [Gammaproteobacteria bacterium]
MNKLTRITGFLPVRHADRRPCDRPGHTTGRPPSPLLLALVLPFLLPYQPVRAAVVHLTATADTYITENPGLGGTGSIHGSDTSLWLARGSGGNREIPLVRFDLTGLAGATVNGAFAQLTLQLVTAFNGTPGITQTVSLRESLVGWDEATTSFAGFGGTGFDEAAHTGPELLNLSVTFSGSPPEPVVFDLPASVVQGWIDDPASNHGLVLISQTTLNQTDLVFASRERDGGTLAPALSFDVTPVPLPPAAGLLGLALLALSGLGRREAGSRGGAG